MSSCGVTLNSGYTGNDSTIQIYDLDFTGLQNGSIIDISVTSVERPDYFSVLIDGNPSQISGWIGFATYSGPWGPTLNGPTSYNFSAITYDNTKTYAVRIEVGFADPGDPQQDTYSVSVACSPPTTPPATPPGTPDVTPSNTPTPNPTPTNTPSQPCVINCFNYEFNNTNPDVRTLFFRDCTNPNILQSINLPGGFAGPYVSCIKCDSMLIGSIPVTGVCSIGSSTNVDGVVITAGITTCDDLPCEDPTPTPTNTSSNTPTNSQTPTQTPTNTETPTQTQTPTNTETPTQTQTPTNTETPTQTPTNTETPTQTQTPTNTETPTQTQTPTNTETPTNTATPGTSPSNTPSMSETNTPTPTNTQTQTSTPGSTPVSTSTVTPTNTQTQTSTPGSTPVSTPTVTPTNTQTQTSTP
jgi:hypothetical protein